MAPRGSLGCNSSARKLSEFSAAPHFACDQNVGLGKEKCSVYSDSLQDKRRLERARDELSDGRCGRKLSSGGSRGGRGQLGFPPGMPGGICRWIVTGQSLLSKGAAFDVLFAPSSKIRCTHDDFPWCSNRTRMEMKHLAWLSSGKVWLLGEKMSSLKDAG